MSKKIKNLLVLLRIKMLVRNSNPVKLIMNFIKQKYRIPVKGNLSSSQQEKMIKMVCAIINT